MEELGKVCMDLDFLSSFDPRIVSVPVMVIWQLALFAGGLLLGERPGSIGGRGQFP